MQSRSRSRDFFPGPESERGPCQISTNPRNRNRSRDGRNTPIYFRADVVGIGILNFLAEARSGAEVIHGAGTEIIQKNSVPNP